jgi:hypothetical protein
MMDVTTPAAIYTAAYTLPPPGKPPPLNRYQPHPAEPEQHTKCSNRAFVLLKMGIMIPETF